MTDTQVFGTITDIMAVLLLVEIACAVVAIVYIVRIYRASTRTSALFRTITVDDVIKVLAGVWVGGLAVWRLIPVQPDAHLPIWTAPISAFVIMVLLWPPIHHALTFHSLRKKRSPNPTPPPFGEDD